MGLIACQALCAKDNGLSNGADYIHACCCALKIFIFRSPQAVDDSLLPIELVKISSLCSNLESVTDEKGTSGFFVLPIVCECWRLYFGQESK